MATIKVTALQGLTMPQIGRVRAWDIFSCPTELTDELVAKKAILIGSHEKPRTVVKTKVKVANEDKDS